ncbi:MAG: hypothetical protein K2X28_08895 [Alphaproteobacteria bacterium]|nr:hypothetical protein [Alphaproteobacteria bacterium]
MKKNLFMLMLSTFVLINAQQSYAVDTGEEGNKSSQECKKKRPVPQAPMKSELLAEWEERIKNDPKCADWEIRDKQL